MDTKGLDINSSSKNKWGGGILRQNNETLDVLIKASPLAIIALDKSAKILIWNPAAEHLFGWSESEIKGKPYPLVPESELDDFRKLIKNEFKGKRHYAKEIKRLHKNGTLINVSLWTAPIKDDDGQMYAVLGMMSDNTENKKIKETLRQRDEMLSAMGAMAKVGAWEFDAITGKGTWTEEVAKIHEVDPEAETSLEYEKEFYRGESRQIIEKAIKEAIEHGKPYDLELEIVTHKGNLKWVRTIAHPIIEGGKVTRVRGSFQDITERKKSREELVFKNSILLTQQETALDGILVVDENSKIISCNHRFAKLWEIPENLIESGEDEPVLQMVLSKVMNPETFLAKVKHLYEHRDEKSFDEIFLKNGRILERYSAPMFGDNEYYYGRIWYFRDITERKQAEQQLHLLGTALYATADAIMITEINGNIAWVNPAFTILTGYSFEEALNKKPQQLVKSGIHDKAFYKNMWGTILAGNVWKGETTNRRKNGSIYTEQQTISPVRTEKGEITHFIAIKQDITERNEAQTALKLSEERFRNLFDQAGDGIFIVDWDTRFIDANEEGLEMLGYTRAELLTMKVTDIFPGPDDPIRLQDMMTSIKEGYVHLDEWKYTHKNGSESFAEVSAKKFSNDYYLAIVRDITERKLSDEKIRRLNRLYKVISGINTLIVRVKQREELFNEACQIAVRDGEFRMVWIGILSHDKKSLNPVAYAGYDNGYLEIIKPLLMVNNKNNKTVAIQALKNKRFVILNKIQDDAPGIFWKKEALVRGYNAMIALPLIVDNEVMGVINLYSDEQDSFDDKEVAMLNELTGDISFALQTIMQQERLEFLSSYDPLTGLSNRTMFNEHLNYVLNSASQTKSGIALVVLDLKQLRQINNAFGRKSGDIVLKEMASRLQRISEDPANVGRISGDYFAMILSSNQESANVVHKIQESIIPVLTKPYLILGNKMQVDIVLGVSIFPTDGGDAETLYRNAEAALKKAKESNIKYLFYQSEMTARVAERLLLENKLKRALEEDQFILYYQPKVDADTHNIKGLEALIRWNDPDTGLVPPNDFIPLLEQNGMILDVGIWAMKKALEDAEYWRSQRVEPPHIAINVSAMQLQQDNFVEIVTKIVKKHGGKDCVLDLEVTESLFMENIEEYIEKLAAIRKLGINISIDDFGTGYSSLGYLSKLPVNALKIDRSFILAMDKEPESMTIVASMITLAHSLRLKVIAEGVETEDQSKLLRLLNCDEMQGYLFSKPLPPKEIFKLLLH